MESKYILQYGSLAGWPFKVAKGLRDKGVNSKNVVLYDRDVLDLKRELPYDRALCDFKSNPIVKGAAIFRYIFEAAKDASLIHYHSGTIFLRHFHHLFEGPFFSKRNIPMLLSFGGTDARIISMAKENNPFYHLDYNQKYDDKIRRKLDSMSKYIRFCATDYEMMTYVSDYFEKSFVFRQPVDLNLINCCFPDPDRKRPVVLHIPTNPLVKGTKFVDAAIDKLNSEGLDFEYRYVRRLTQMEMYQEIQNADIYVDEMRIGSHGVTAVETMAAGKPTVTYIRDDLVEKFPDDFPIVNANPESLPDVLRELILDGNARREIGVKSRKYVEKYHDINVVADDLLEIYREVGYQG